ncbi:MAG: hypothetical protein ACRDFQ_03935 [Anaerolineales bacterium]
MNNLKSQMASKKAIHRADLLVMLQAANDAGEARFARELSEDWLNLYPYDMPVELARARALIQDHKLEKAFKILIRLAELDPEFVEAQELLSQVARRIKPELAEIARSATNALRALPSQTDSIQDWAQRVRNAVQAIKTGDLQKAESEIQSALVANPNSPLSAILHLDISRKLGYTWHAVNKLIELYRQDWPHALRLKLLDAAQKMEAGQEKAALDLLHECVSEDVSGQVAARLWGSDHQFKALWPTELTMTVNRAMPAKVAAALGWNQLEEGKGGRIQEIVPEEIGEAKGVSEEELSKPTSISKIVQTDPVELAESNSNELFKIDLAPETPIDLESIKTDAESLGLRADGRYPVYVAISARGPLTQQYGVEGFAQIDAALQSMVKATALHPHWDSKLLYIDEEESVSPYGLNAVKAGDAWEIKKLLTDLDAALHKKGEMIGALLIAGGPQIIPFHHLPNPVDDEDKDVPSDNPYASIDENYFIPTWAVGRLPNGDGDDPGILLKSINKITSSRTSKSGPIQKVEGGVARLMAFFGLWKPKRAAFGYSAQIWQRASHNVYRTIGEPRQLSISPPTESGKLPKDAAKTLQLAYFNLHGLEDTAEWYGQRDPQITPQGQDYPIALTPRDIINSGRAPQIVFTEACYGANIFGKTAESALALKFLDSGSKAIIGSTVTSYGSVTTPLIAADLLGQTFWRLLNEGYPAGEALRRAKIAMAHTMHRRQGYLDGEDQKTLISFVLYGDPLGEVAANGSANKRILRPDSKSEAMNAICDRSEKHSTPLQELPADALAIVKSVVKDYLPGMQGSAAKLSHEHLDCVGHKCTLPHNHKSLPGLAPSRSLVTLSKKVPGGTRMHPHYARITMDALGKVVKLAVSR